MEIIEIEKPPKRMELYYAGDVHYPRGKIRAFRRMLDEIPKKRYRYLVGMGDWVECIVSGDKRYDPEEMAKIVEEYKTPVNMVDEQWNLFEEDMKVLNKCSDRVFLLGGNHEYKYMQRTSHNGLKSVCRRNDFTYLGNGFSALIFQYPNKDFVSIQSHGYGSGTSVGYPYTNLDKHSNAIADFDIIAEGHTHKLGLNVSVDRLKVNSNDLRQHRQYQIATGSFLTNFDVGSTNYAERMGLRPLPIGYIKCEVVNGVVERIYPVVM